MVTNRNPQFLQIEIWIPVQTERLLHFDNYKLNRSDVNVHELVFVDVPPLKVIHPHLVKGVELGAGEGVPVAGDGDADLVVRPRILHPPRVHGHLVGNQVRLDDYQYFQQCRFVLQCRGAICG